MTQGPLQTVLQFGAGRFLRGFIDRFISELNAAGDVQRQVVVVQSTAGGRADLLNQHPEGFPVVVRGIEAGQVIEREVWVDSIRRAIQAKEQWSEVVEVACDPNMQLVVTNATEAGYVLTAEPFSPSVSPTTLPGKLTASLFARFQRGGEAVTILPCELISRNGDRLRDLVVQQAEQWGLASDFQHYLAAHCVWLNNLVDCMVSDLPPDHPQRQLNPLAIMAEPYALLAIEQPIQSTTIPLSQHPAVRLVDELEPYYLRKVRVLNGIHTAMVAKYFGSPLATVQQVLANPEGNRWARDVLYGEILPTLLGKVDGAVEFVDATFDRLRNPFLAHSLRDIRLNHEQKVPVRLVPTADDYQHIFGRRPQLLQSAITTQLKDSIDMANRN